MTEEIEFLGNIIEVSDEIITFSPHCLYCGKILDTKPECETVEEAKSLIRDKLYICSYKCLGKYAKEHHLEHYLYLKNLLEEPTDYKIGKFRYEIEFLSGLVIIQ